MNELSKPLFTRKEIVLLIVPLIIEQFLAVSVGMADTMMIAGVGEQAVSGISVIDSINILIIQVFTALATGGAVVSSHLLGENNSEKACKSANQLIMICFAISAMITIISICFNPQIITLIFNVLEDQVFGYARTYFYITALSFPFLAVYNACAALCRSMGKSGISMRVAILMNGLNITGNAILIFGFHMKVEGAAISTLISRMVACLIIFKTVFNIDFKIHVLPKLSAWIPDFNIIKRILTIGIPVAIENGLFQGGKLIIAGLVSTFGTASIAANAVGNNLASFQSMPGMAMGLGLITLVGQSIGAKRYEEAKKYTVGMCIAVTICHAAIALPMCLFMNHLIGIYHLSKETTDMAYRICMLHGVCCFITWPWSFTLPNALRAAEDVKFVMTVSMLSMAFCRVALSYVFGKYLGMGLFGVWLAMMCDWVVRLLFFVPRFISGGWLKKHKKRVSIQ